MVSYQSYGFLQLQEAVNNKDLTARSILDCGFCKVFFLMGNRKLCHLQRIDPAQRPAKEVLILGLHFSLVPRAVCAFHINTKCERHKQSLGNGMEAR